jgi:hypothetical protein
MKNKIALKTLHALSHPLSIGAILLILINDHILRIYWPSWWTGKLGDFAWLFFIPFALAAVIAWLIPSNWKQQELLVGVLAYAFTGGIFTLAKTCPPFHLWLIDLLERLLGIPIGLRCDPTDLIALPSLAASCWMWTRPIRFQHRSIQKGLMLMPAAALLTIANVAQYPPQDNKGIDCLLPHEKAFLAYDTSLIPSWDDAYISEDGGYSWTATSIDEKDDCEAIVMEQLSDPSNADLRYRFGNEAPIIEISTDGGSTWPEEFQIRAFGEVEEIIIRYAHTGPYVFQIGPQDALIDPSSGNLLLAMGFRGLLMRESNGQWKWIPVGIYRFIEETPPEYVRMLMSGQFFLAASFLFLGISTATARLIRKAGLFILLGLFWIIWIFSVFVSYPANFVSTGRGYSPGILIPSFLMLLALLSLLVVLFLIPFIIRHHRKDLRRILLPATIGAGLFLIPFILWVKMLIPYFGTAIILGIVLAVIPLLVGDQWHRLHRKSKLGVRQPPQEKTDRDA